MTDREAATWVLMRRILPLAALALVCGCVGVSEVSRPSVNAVVATAVEALGECRGAYRSYMVRGQRYWVRGQPPGHSEKGLASWYGKPFHGRKTASGEIFDMHQLSAAHKTLPLFSIVKVTNLYNGREVTVRINDRGPFSGERLIDLSYAVAKKLDMVEAGVVPVKVTIAEMPNGHRGYAALSDLVKINY